MLRPYRLELEGRPFLTTTYTTDQGARRAARYRAKWAVGGKWRITKRIEGSRRTEFIAEGTYEVSP